MVFEWIGMGVPISLIILILLIAFGIQEYKEGGIMNIIKMLYVLTITAFLIMLVVFGISAFYQQPEYGYGQWEGYEEAMRNYNHNVFYISYPCGLVFVMLGLFLRPRLNIFRLGLILGGMGIIIYAIELSHLEGEFRFAGAAIGFIVLLYIGYKTLLERKPASGEKT